MAFGIVYSAPNQTLVSSGQTLIDVEPGHETTLFWNILNAPTGTSPTIQFILQEVDPNDNTTAIGISTSSSIINTTGVGQIVLRQGTSPTLLLKWVLTGTSPSFTGVSLSVAVREISIGTVTQPVSQVVGTTSRLSSAVVNATSSGDNTLVAGVASQTVRIFRLALVLSSSNTITFKDGASTPLTGAMSLNAGATILLDYEGEPWFVTNSGNNFILNLGNASAVTGVVYYTQS